MGVVTLRLRTTPIELLHSTLRLSCPLPYALLLLIHRTLLCGGFLLHTFSLREAQNSNLPLSPQNRAQSQKHNAGSVNVLAKID